MIPIKEEYRKQMDAIKPSPALEEETLALMAEARDRGLQAKEKPAPKLRFLPIAIGAAAVLAITVTVTAAMGGVLRRNRTVDEGAGDYAMPGDYTNGSAEKTGKESFDLGGAPSAGAALDPETSDAGETMRAPNEYDSLAAFIEALEDNSAPGYGSNYYNKRALVVVPAALPDYAEFNGLTLDPESGNYTYSYTFAAEGATYLLTCRVEQTLPKTVRELEAALARLKEDTEAGDNWFADNTYVWEYGDWKLTAALTVKATGEPVEHEKTVELLAPFRAERCRIDNTVIQMKTGG